MFAGKQCPFAALAPKPKQGEVGWVPYVQVDDVDSATRKAVKLGAVLVHEKERGPAGEFTVVRDPGGSTIAPWQKACAWLAHCRVATRSPSPRRSARCGRSCPTRRASPSGGRPYEPSPSSTDRSRSGRVGAEFDGKAGHFVEVRTEHEEGRKIAYLIEEETFGLFKVMTSPAKEPARRTCLAQGEE